MGLLRVSEQFDNKLLRTMFKFLRREHKATISEPVDLHYFFEYHVEGEDIPVGRKNFHLEIEEIVPKVLAIRIA